ncbi:histidinol-phosphatase [Alteribacter natronophilus]|uniref:histidinol-phosphatase n=1 Tax=Alteribacter natronophilus TaxID=2583810 RepID=UPI00110ECE89|nr:histidinol-phosphatase [Alteribacter natronophilus]TMW73639.1 histidinol-phosphatase [Alteribacter natronophilus]
MRTDYHNHLEKGTLTLEYLKQFAKKADEEGIREFGISEHAYHFYETADILSNEWVDARRWYTMKEYTDLFREAEREGLNVKMSIEMDYTPGKHEEMAEFIQAYPFDYVIGSIHWVGNFGIDLAEYRKEWDRRDVKEVYRHYFDQVVTLAQSNLFDVIGHLDLVKIFGYVPDDREFLLSEYERITSELAESKTCVEISTAGLRKPVGRMYPEPELLAMCRRKGIPIVLSSDAHEPEHVGYRYQDAVKLAREAGYSKVMTFSEGRRKEEDLT